jgi:hypothetical protein
LYDLLSLLSYETFLKTVEKKTVCNIYALDIMNLLMNLLIHNYTFIQKWARKSAY